MGGFKQQSMLFLFQRFMKRKASQNFKALSTLSLSSKRTNLKTFVDHDVKHVYNIVSDIDRYSEFVPWCTQSKIVKVIGPNEVLADLTVGFQGLSEETFRSRVFVEPNHSVTSIASCSHFTVEEVELLTHEFSKLAAGKHRLSKEDLRNWLIWVVKFKSQIHLN